MTKNGFSQNKNNNKKINEIKMQMKFDPTNKCEFDSTYRNLIRHWAIQRTMTPSPSHILPMIYLHHAAHLLDS